MVEAALLNAKLVLVDKNPHWTMLLWTKRNKTLHTVAGAKRMSDAIKHLKKMVPYIDRFVFTEVKDMVALDKQLRKDEVKNADSTAKIGVLWCKPGQTDENEIYNNNSCSPAFDDFLQLLGKRVRMAGWPKYAGGLDTTEGSQLESVYTDWGGVEIMFHVGPLLPHIDVPDAQQTEKKRHIGNDIVVVIFMEGGFGDALDIDSFKSQFNTVFILVAPHRTAESVVIGYSMLVVMDGQVKPFGPQIPRRYTFDDLEYFRDFLLCKIIQAELAALKTTSFDALSQRTKKDFLDSLARKYLTHIK